MGSVWKAYLTWQEHAVKCPVEISTKNTAWSNWPVWSNVWVFLYELSGSGFGSSCSHLNFRFRTCFGQGYPWHSGNYRVRIHSKMRTWHDKNIQLKICLFFLELIFMNSYIWKLGESWYRSFTNFATNIVIRIDYSEDMLLEKIPAYIPLDEDVLEASIVFVCRRRIQDALVKTNIFVMAILLQDVFKTFSRRFSKKSSRRFQDVFKTSWKNAFKTSSRCLQDVFQTSSRSLAEMPSNCSCKQTLETYSTRFNTLWDVSIPNSIKLATIFAKRLHHRCLTGLKIGFSG